MSHKGNMLRILNQMKHDTSMAILGMSNQKYRLILREKLNAINDRIIEVREW